METWKRTVYVSIICAFFMSVGVNQVTPILPLYFHEMGVETPQELALWSGLASGMTFIVVCLVAPFWGRLADRKGRKLMLIRSSLGMALCNVCIALQHTPIGVVICRLVQGLVNGFYSASITLLAAEVPLSHTGWALGLLASFNLAGSLVGPLIGGYLATELGIRNDFYAIGISMFIAFLLVLFFVHEDYEPDPSKSTVSFKELRQQLPEFNSIVGLSVASFIYAVSIMALQPIISVYIKGMVPSDAENVALIAGAVFSSMGIAQLLSSSPLGRLVDRIGPKKVLIVSFLYVGLLNIPQAYVTDVWQLGIVRFLQGFGLGGMLPALNTYLASKTPKHLAGQVFSYNQSCLFLGYFIGSVGGATLMAALGFTTLFWVGGILFILTAVWITLRLQ